jgi:hypothetical protein
MRARKCGRKQCGRGVLGVDVEFDVSAIRALMSIGKIEVNKGQRLSQMGALTRISSRARISPSDFSSPRSHIRPGFKKERCGA